MCCIYTYTTHPYDTYLKMSVYAHRSLDSEKCTRPYPGMSPTQRGALRQETKRLRLHIFAMNLKKGADYL